MDLEEMRIIFRGLEYRLVYRPHEDRASTLSCSVRDGDDWQEFYGHMLREAEDKFTAGYYAVVTHAYEHGREV